MSTGEVLTNINFDDVTLTLPSFSIGAEVFFQAAFVDGTSIPYWRTNGQTGTIGHTVGFVSTNARVSNSTVNVVSDSSQIIEVKMSANSGNTITAVTQGWYFPIGM